MAVSTSDTLAFMPGFPNHPFWQGRVKSNNINNIVVGSSQGLEEFGNFITWSWETLKE